MASSHMRRRPVSPMLTQSDTAPMVQKWVLLPTAPKMNARRNAPPRYIQISFRSTLGKRGEALLGARRGAAPRILRDQLLQGLARAPRSPIVSCALAMESIASGAFGLSGQEASSFLCAAMAFL